MESQYHASLRVSSEVLRELTVRSDGPAIVRFAVQYSLLVGSVILLVLRYQEAWWQWTPGILVFAFTSASMYAIMHETLHRTAFRSPLLNSLALYLASLPLYYMPSCHRYFHFTHHQFTQDPSRDPEISITGQPTSSFVTYVFWISGLGILFYKLGVIVAASLTCHPYFWNRILYYIPDVHRGRLRLEARLYLLFHLGLLALSLTWLPGLLLLIPGQLLGHMLVALFASADHNGLPVAGGILSRTRTVRTNPFVRFWMWNLSYHAEHHAYPAVPWHALPRLHSLLESELVNQTRGYSRFHVQVIKQLAAGEPFQQT